MNNLRFSCAYALRDADPSPTWNWQHYNFKQKLPGTGIVVSGHLDAPGVPPPHSLRLLEFSDKLYWVCFLLAEKIVGDAIITCLCFICSQIHEAALERLQACSLARWRRIWLGRLARKLTRRFYANDLFFRNAVRAFVVWLGQLPLSLSMNSCGRVFHHYFILVLKTSPDVHH